MDPVEAKPLISEPAVDYAEGEGDDAPEAEIVSLSIELGDIIRIIAPTHQEIHDHTFFVDYVSSRKIKLIDTESITDAVLTLDATGKLTTKV